jgi:hypothetical protein
MTPVKQSMTFRRGKKNAPEPEQKLELDLANALPSSDDFRTSLLMSGLSARFSMLREQDNPNSKIGKASDDSVLFPKRQSRLPDFGFSVNGLSDIAEVASIKSSVRPRFMDRTDSYYSAEGYGTDDDFGNTGNIMARAKPAGGNNLFGGRQKIYKIPMSGSASMRNLDSNGEERPMAGRALYDDDVSQSAFQKLREREKQEQENERWARDETAQASPPRRSNSPTMTGYNWNRETSSTTASGPSLTRSSTAATSVTSQRTPSLGGYSSPSTPSIPNQSNGSALDRSFTKPKRLYETGLDHHLHSQQYSAMNRLDSLSRQRPLDARTPSPSLPSPIVATFDGSEPLGINTKNNIQSSGPTPTSHNAGAFDFGVKSSNGLEAPKQPYMSPPLSPPMSEGDGESNLAIQPNDRGKATALGAFSKPAQPYDENKYSQRQLQMQEGRRSPPPRVFHSGQQAPRARAESNSTYSSGRSRSSSSAQREFVPHNRFAPVLTRTEITTTNNYNSPSGTFLTSPDGSTMSSPRENGSDGGKSWGQAGLLRVGASNLSSASLSAERPPESEHPANRQHSPRLWADFTGSEDADVLAIAHAEVPSTLHRDPPEDSPTLGPATGLNGMVRQHLRSESNTSDYDPPSPVPNHQFPPQALPAEMRYKTAGNPWEVNDWDHEYYGQREDFSQISPKPMRRNEMPHEVSSPTKNVNRFPGSGQSASMPAWEKEVTKHVRHTRDGSSETQKEREDFANELATRRRRVQENLRSFADPDSRSASPAPGMDRPRDASISRNNPIEMLKSKPSRGSIVSRSKDGQSKAMKMLGLSGPSNNSSHQHNQTFEDNLWKREEEEMMRGVAKSPRAPPPTKAYRQARRDAQRDRERDLLMRHQQRAAAAESSDSDGKHVGLVIRPRSVSPVNDENAIDAPKPELLPSTQIPADVPRPKRAPSEESKHSAATTQSGSRSGSRPESRNFRDRSSSDVSGRSKSRNGRYRDDLAKAMAEGAGSSAQSSLEEVTRMPARAPATGFYFQDTGNMTSTSFGNRSRSNSKSGYLDSHGLQQIQTNQMMDIGVSPRPSPITPFSVNSTPALVQPSPVGSGAATPTGQGFQSQGRIPAARKRSVNKSEISEPTLLSMTSRITTVNLPPGASLSNGSNQSAPPVPPINPRRRQTRTMFGALTGRSAEALPIPSLPIQNHSNEEFINFSADEGESKRPRQKLRKSSSEGGNLNVRGRAAFAAQPSPALPGTFPNGTGAPLSSMQGGMI